MRSFIAKRFETRPAGLSLDTEALARYSDVIDLSIGDSTVSFQLAGVKDAPRLVDLMTGDVYQVPETLVKRDDLGNVVELVNLPLTDSPLLLMFGDFDD